MRIGVLTWYKVVNHGAVLQAYALEKCIENYGHEAIMLDYQRNLDSMDDELMKKIIRGIKRFNLSGLQARKALPKWNKDKKELFEVFRMNELHIGEQYDIDQELSATVVGSDMVFDFYEGYNPFMYGKNVVTPFIFSYAASFGYITEKLFKSYSESGEIITLLSKFNGISYRDNNTGILLEKQCGIKNCVKVIDPVMLYSFINERTQWDTGKWREKKYILIYSYTFNMDKATEVIAIRKFAKEKGLQVISVGYYHKWCDINVNASPYEFVELFKHAKYVITDTFHGTVFSLTFGKQFRVVVRNNAFKVIDLLSDLGIQYLAKNDLQHSLNSFDKAPIDYIQVDRQINKLRQESMDYLKQQLITTEGKQ